MAGLLTGLPVGFAADLPVGLLFLTATGAGFLRTTFLAGRDAFLGGADTVRRGLAAFLIAFFA
ncbi:MAG: hypothetical protein ACKPJJ_26920, partial [Planctomycetaceae bacterium]